MGDDFFPVVSPTVVPSEPKVRLKPRWLNVKAPAPLQATLANVAHLEMGMMLGADDEEVAKMMCRPYTSVGSTQFNESCSQFSLRPSSLYSGHSRCSSRSWRKFNSPSAACGLRSPTPSTRDSRGYESLEQLLTPWPSSNGLSPPSATPAVSRTRRSRPRATSNRATSNDTGTTLQTPATPVRERSLREAGGPSPESPAATPVGQSLWSKAQKAKVLLCIPKKPSTAPAAPTSRRRNGLKVEQVDEDGSATASTSDSEESADSVDPVLQKTIGNLMPGKSLWGAAIKTAQVANKQKHLLRRTGLDDEMMELAKFAVAAQQAALREEEEMNMPIQVLPGVYFGHLEPPDVSRLPASGRIAHLQKMEKRKVREDTVDQRSRYNIPDEDPSLPPPLFADPRGAYPMPFSRDSGKTRRKAVNTWDPLAKTSEQKVLSQDEQAKLKEEKVAYDDWRREVMVCTRLLNTHINRFETEPVKGAPQYQF